MSKYTEAMKVLKEKASQKKSVKENKVNEITVLSSSFIRRMDGTVNGRLLKTLEKTAAAILDDFWNSGELFDTDEIASYLYLKISDVLDKME